MVTLNLTKFCSVVGLFVKAIKCLESTQSTVSDVYIFCVSIAAHLKELLDSPNVGGLAGTTTKAIYRIFNSRFEKLRKGTMPELYLVGAVLDPREFFNSTARE